MAKSVKKPALGRGLSSLLNNDSTVASKTISYKGVTDLDIQKITPNSSQPRTNFNEEDLNELAQSISELGIIQPITVREIKEGSYQIISGERRYRASKMVGLKSVPAYVRTANDVEVLEMALVENVQRSDLDPIEIGLGFQALLDEVSLSHEELSKRVGKKRSTITNYIRLLKLDPIVQSGIRDGFLSMAHGRAIINVESKEEQLEFYEKIIRHDLSVRKTEELVKNRKKVAALPKTPTEEKEPSFNLNEDKEKLTSYFDSNVSFTYKGSGGLIHIPFNSLQDFNRIKKLMKIED